MLRQRERSQCLRQRQRNYDASAKDAKRERGFSRALSKPCKYVIDTKESPAPVVSMHAYSWRLGLSRAHIIVG